MATLLVASKQLKALEVDPLQVGKSRHPPVKALTLIGKERLNKIAEWEFTKQEV